MFNKKEMKLIEFKKAKKKLYDGECVFMVRMDNALVELTESTDWKTILFHNIKGGSYAVYRRKFNSSYRKEIHFGSIVFALEHTKKGGDSEWKNASYRDKL